MDKRRAVPGREGAVVVMPSPHDGWRRRWRLRVGCSASSWPRHYGVHVGEDVLGGHGEHYGYPWKCVGVWLLTGHNMWFLGAELERVEL
jgi:hypothetical protein